MLPVPRITAANELNSQSGTAPANTSVEYVTAAASEPSRPPISA